MVQLRRVPGEDDPARRHRRGGPAALPPVRARGAHRDCCAPRTEGQVNQCGNCGWTCRAISTILHNNTTQHSRSIARRMCLAAHSIRTKGQMEKHECCESPIDHDGKLKMPYIQRMRRAAQASCVADARAGQLSPASAAAQQTRHCCKQA